jgi:hypothetical protein
MKATQDQPKLKPLGRATEQTKGFWGAFREEAGSASRHGQIP